MAFLHATALPCAAYSPSFNIVYSHLLPTNLSQPARALSFFPSPQTQFVTASAPPHQQSLTPSSLSAYGAVSAPNASEATPIRHFSQEKTKKKSPSTPHVHSPASRTAVQMKKKSSGNIKDLSKKTKVSKNIFQEEKMKAPATVIVVQDHEEPKQWLPAIPLPAPAPAPAPASVPLLATAPSISASALTGHPSHVEVNSLESLSPTARDTMAEQISVILTASSINDTTATTGPSETVPILWQVLRQLATRWTQAPFNTHPQYRDFETFYVQLFLNTALGYENLISSHVLTSIRLGVDFPHFRAFASSWTPTLTFGDANNSLENFDFFLRAYFEPYIAKSTCLTESHWVLHPNILIDASSIEDWNLYFESELFRKTAAACHIPQWMHTLGSRDLSVGSLFRSCVRFIKSLPFPLDASIFADMDALLVFEYRRTVNQLTLAEFFTYFLEPYADTTIGGDFSAKLSFPIPFLRDNYSTQDVKAFVRSREFQDIVGAAQPPLWYVDFANEGGFAGFVANVIDIVVQPTRTPMAVYETVPDLLHLVYLGRVRSVGILHLHHFELTRDVRHRDAFFRCWEIMTMFVSLFPKFAPELLRMLQGPRRSLDLISLLLEQFYQDDPLPPSTSDHPPPAAPL